MNKIKTAVQTITVAAGPVVVAVLTTAPRVRW